jgi:proteasome lid subunit RPN8/RPN11
MDASTLQAIRDHAQAEYPRESCGVVVVRKGRERYAPCRNTAAGNDHFSIHPEDYAAAEEDGEITRIIHSHPNVPPAPSDADKVGCEASGIPWGIVNWPTGIYAEFEPSGYRAPLIGRDFSYGVLDCYSLIQDYYRALGIALPDFDHPDYFWENGGNLYEENFGKAGFYVVDSVEPHDVILMMVGATVANHGAVYIGNNQIVHHLMHRLSSRDVYGGYFQKMTVRILRHKDISTITTTPEEVCEL